MKALCVLLLALLCGCANLRDTTHAATALNTDLSDPNQRVNVDRKLVKSIETSKISPMPPMLLSMLKKEEILDLLAYVLSGGDSENEMFTKK